MSPEEALHGLGRRIEELLGDEDEGVRVQAATCAGALRLAALVPGLVRGLSDPDNDVRAACARALASIEAPASEAALLRTVKEDTALDCKLAAIEALRALRATSAIPILRALIRGRGEDIAWRETREEGWDDWPDVQIAAIRTVEALGGEQAVADIEAALNGIEAQDLSTVACRAFVKLGASGQAALERCFASGSARLRREAIAAMLESPSVENADRLRRLLKDSDASVRRAAVGALAKIDPADTSLVPVLKDRSPQVAVDAVRACGHLHPRELAPLARHSRAAVREAVACAVERMSADQGSVDATLITRVLPHLLSDPMPAVAVAAISAVAAVHRAGALPLLIRFIDHQDAAPEVAAAAAQALGKLGTSAACPPLARAARSSNSQVRLAALTALARIATSSESGAQAAARVLIEIIEEAAEGLDASELPRFRKDVPPGDEISVPRDAVRLAVRALAERPGKDSIKALSASLRIGDEALQVAALQALRRLHRNYAADARGTREAMDQVSQCESDGVRIQVAMLAAELGEARGYHDCADMLRGGSRNAQRMILEAITHDDLRADESIFDAVQLLLADETLRPVALSALAKARPRVVTVHLVEMLASGDHALQRSAHEILTSGVIHRDTALYALEQALTDPKWSRVRVRILEALAALGERNRTLPKS